MATGRLVFWSITSGHTLGLNRASFRPGAPLLTPPSHSVTSQDPKQSHRHRWGPAPKVNRKKQSPKCQKSCVCVGLTYGQIVQSDRLFPGASWSLSELIFSRRFMAFLQERPSRPAFMEQSGFVPLTARAVTGTRRCRCVTTNAHL